MSILAYVLCVLLVATVNAFCIYQQPLVQATTATDDGFVTERPTDMLPTVINEAIERYEFAKNTVKEILSQIKFEKPLDIDTWTPVGQAPPRTECYEFLKKHIETHRSVLADCSRPVIANLNSDLEELEKWLKPILKRFDELKSFGERCVAWSDLFSDAASKAAMCMDEVYQEIAAINRRDSNAITRIITSARDRANQWAREVGHCVGFISEGDEKTEEWRTACMQP